MGQFSKGCPSKAEEYILERQQSAGRGNVEPRRADVEANEVNAEDAKGHRG